eukprot:6315566-Amphidinium_carterae.1
MVHAAIKMNKIKKSPLAAQPWPYYFKLAWMLRSSDMRPSWVQHQNRIRYLDPVVCCCDLVEGASC